MYLKSIQMQGFKSFADKTKIVFDQGVTAVVGPNGSGKSNITESLRWALGESSAKSLRGGKMPDVIFAGTQDRKPLNYASVVVTLDNSQGFIENHPKEIKIERHIYRSGDSEYLIDGKKVRLRDIHDLFMDTGLGRDSFSIISQGRVEAIFNSKPEERRAIFEEAAGVLKYKTRKKETETKLSQTQDNLERLEDIIYELDNQIKPLEKQAQAAKRFLELDGKRREVHLDVLVEQIRRGRSDLTAKEESLAQVRTELSEYYAQRDQLERENQELKGNRHQFSEKLDEKQKNLLDVTHLVSDLERKIEVHQLESTQNESSKKDAQERLMASTEKLTDLQKQLLEKETHEEKLKKDLYEVRDRLTQVSQEILHFSEDPDQIIEHLREQFVKLMQEEANQSNQLTKLEQEVANQLHQSESQSQELEKLKEQRLKTAQELEKSQAELTLAESALKALLANYEATQREVAETENRYQQKQNSLFDLLDQVKAKQARKASLEAILKNHSNFYAGVKAVLQAKKELGGVIGAVSEHLTFDTQYQTALEIALGASSQNIIVEDEETAKKAINFLKKNRQGRATFLPVTTVKPRHIAGQLLQTLEQSTGYLGCADELVSYQPRLASIFQNLLGAIAVFDTIDHANQAAHATRFQVRMVTLDGSEIRPGGVFAGGTNRNQNTIFIKPELDELVAEIDRLTTDLHCQEHQVAELKDTLEQGRKHLDGIKEEGENARLSEQRIRLSHEQIKEKMSDVTRLYELQMKQVVNGNLSELEELKMATETALQNLAEKKELLNQQIEEVKHNRNAIQENLQELQDTQSQLKVEENQLMSEIRFAQTEKKRLGEEVIQAEQESSTLQTIIEQKMEALDDTSIEALKDQLQQAQTKKTDINQSLLRLKFELEDIEGRLDDLEERLEQARLKNDDLIRRQAKLEADVDQGGQGLRTLILNLTEDYKMSFDEASKQAATLADLPSAEKELKDLERTIRSLGPINLDAIEQYDEVNNRLAFLTSQKEDVLSARDLLLATIDDMDDEVKERFKVTFEAIRESFQLTFKQMFGGGSADLLLTSSDLLNAGIEISVQPPGKKIQSLNLMSGGEKALSALALLFSIIRVKAIPFVILDEVEAALDEANVKRFGDYLNRFDKSSQFIVVTHRKGTMAAADAIYGVTMQESGVSKIVSVKLKDGEK